MGGEGELAIVGVIEVLFDGGVFVGVARGAAGHHGHCEGRRAGLALDLFAVFLSCVHVGWEVCVVLGMGINAGKLPVYIRNILVSCSRASCPWNPAEPFGPTASRFPRSRLASIFDCRPSSFFYFHRVLL